MIQEDYVTFEQAKLLKEKGFPQEIDEDFPDRTMILFSDAPNNIIDYNSAEIQGFLDDEYLKSHNIEWYVTPTLSLVDKWLRKEKNIDINISCNKGVTYKYYDCYIHEISDFICDKEDNPIKFNTYEEALSEGINKALELI